MSDSLRPRSGAGARTPLVRQFSVQLDDHMAELVAVVRVVNAAQLRVVSLVLTEAGVRGVVRLILGDADRAAAVFGSADLVVTEAEVLVVELPACPDPLGQVCRALQAAGVGVGYAHTLATGPELKPSLALHVDDPDAALAVLSEQGVGVVREEQLDY